jgi:hypothetical protein
MTLRYAKGAIAIVTLVGGVNVGSSNAQVRDGGILPPDETGLVTVGGCLLRGNQVRGGQDDKYVLANPQKGPVASMPGGACTAEPAANAITLDNPEGRINESMLGRWVEISGRLEKENSTNPDTLRELDVEFARLIPEAAQRAEAVTAPEPAAAPEPHAPAPQPASPRDTAVGTSGRDAEALPQTASYGPMGGIIGLLALAGSLALRSVRVARLG